MAFPDAPIHVAGRHRAGPLSSLLLRARRPRSDNVLEDSGGCRDVVRVPFGPVASIAPWSRPVSLSLDKAVLVGRSVSSTVVERSGRHWSGIPVVWKSCSPGARPTGPCQAGVGDLGPLGGAVQVPAAVVDAREAGRSRPVVVSGASRWIAQGVFWDFSVCSRDPH